MILQSQTEVIHTREKLRELEDRYAALKQDSTEDRHVRDLTLRSLKRLINQLKEQIAVFEAHRTALPRAN